MHFHYIIHTRFTSTQLYNLMDQLWRFKIALQILINYSIFAFLALADVFIQPGGPAAWPGGEIRLGHQGCLFEDGRGLGGYTTCGIAVLGCIKADFLQLEALFWSTSLENWRDLQNSTLSICRCSYYYAAVWRIVLRILVFLFGFSYCITMWSERSSDRVSLCSSSTRESFDIGSTHFLRVSLTCRSECSILTCMAWAPGAHSIILLSFLSDRASITSRGGKEGSGIGGRH